MPPGADGERREKSEARLEFSSIRAGSESGETSATPSSVQVDSRVNINHLIGFLTMEGDAWGGAGAVPYCVHDGKVLFLMQQTKGGKKEGTLIDFGGARDDTVDANVRYCAAREFTEETAGLFTTSYLSVLVDQLSSLDQQGIESSPIIHGEIAHCMELVEEANAKQYIAVTDLKASEWYASYAIKIPYSDLTLQNHFYGDVSKRKVRIFYWVCAQHLRAMLQRRETLEGLPLHERVFCLKNLDSLVEIITTNEFPSPC